ncbi:insulin-induced protein-domain-containing protein [Terfezia claveryi]|nr:insulin-induced protein-domain-containing protein [Terfezia claveryi]
MSSPTNDSVPIYRPKPRRPFDLTPLTSPSPTPEHKHDLPAWVNGGPQSPTTANGTTTPIEFTKRTKSVLNLTASTLFGIYSNTYSDGTEPPTPSSFFMSRTNSQVNVSDTTSNGNGNGVNANGIEKGTMTNGKAFPANSKVEAPRRRRRRGKPTSIPQLILRLSALLIFGIGYGVIVMHLHNTRTFTPAWWEEIGGYNIGFLLLWGLVGVALGSLLPWIDYFLDESEGSSTDGEGGGVMVDWMQVVRSIGAFVGIAYAIRKLPWQSTLQISLTLTLVNPVLWYLVDRTRAGFVLSAFVGVAGTMILSKISPDVIQAPETYTGRLTRDAASSGQSEEMLMGYISYETVGVGAWMWSVLFCSCVCFGNIGRKLAFREKDL